MILSPWERNCFSHVTVRDTLRGEQRCRQYGSNFDFKELLRG